MARYVMINRRAGKFTDEEKLESRAAMSSVMSGAMMSGANIVQDSQPDSETARHVVLFEAEASQVSTMMNELPEDVIVEPEILHRTAAMRPLGFKSASPEELNGPANFGATDSLKVEALGAGNPLEGANVIVFLRGPGSVRRRQSATTDKSGKVQFEFSNIFSSSVLLVIPAGGFWPMIQRGPSGSVQVHCPSLPVDDNRLEWWHERMGITRHRKTRGSGIRVGVIDTGVGPHPFLEHVQSIGSYIGGAHSPDGGADVASHGTHVNGSIGARPTVMSVYTGIAPGTRLLSARVFPANGDGANQVDIVLAIDALSRDHGVDLINMSLGAEVPSAGIQDAIADALERGTLCICAAGNSEGKVEFPGRFAETVAVSSIGLEGWGPSGSMPAGRLPTEEERFGDHNLYHANFSCFGDEVSCAGPGVGILSTVPERFGLEAPYASMDGTSMASPNVCGALAAILGDSPVYKTLPRDETRSAVARQMLLESCRTIGLDPIYQGHGMPLVS